MRLTGIIAMLRKNTGYLAPGRIAPGRSAVPRPAYPAGPGTVRPVNAADTNSA
jgi:hypothetical protein